VEFSGVVEAVGEQVSEWKAGDEVLSLTYGGAYAEYITVKACMLMPKPSYLSWGEAASIPEVWFTAYQALVLHGGLEKGKTVLVHAGASGVGVAAIQIARLIGAKTVYATAGSDAKVRFLLGMTTPPTAAFNYKTHDFAEEIEKLSGKESVDMIVDFVGKDYWERNVRLLARDARIILVAMLSGSKVPELDLSIILRKRLRVEGTALRSRSPEYQAALVARFKEEILPHIRSASDDGGPIKTYIHHSYSWKEAGAAHKEMEANLNAGKIVIVVD